MVEEQQRTEILQKVDNEYQIQYSTFMAEYEPEDVTAYNGQESLLIAEINERESHNEEIRELDLKMTRALEDAPETDVTSMMKHRKTLENLVQCRARETSRILQWEVNIEDKPTAPVRPKIQAPPKRKVQEAVFHCPTRESNRGFHRE